MILIRPSLSAVDEAFRFFNSQDASKRMKLDLSAIPANTVVTLGIRGVDGKIVVGEYDVGLKSYLINS